MDKTTKIIIGVAGGIILLCIAAAAGAFFLLRPGLEQMAEGLIVEDPEEVRALAEEMAGYELPPGYREEMAMNLFGFGRVIYMNAYDNRPMIAWMEFNSAFLGSEEEMRNEMRNSIPRQINGSTSDTTLKEVRDITIAGEETTLYVYEGTDGIGEIVRQWITTFEGNNAPVLVMIMGAAEDWNEAELETFLQSIH